MAMLAGIGWQSIVLAGYLRPGSLFPRVKTCRVTVDGNVRRPGMYMAPEGTTPFEILKVAGIRPTSDLTALNLMGQIEENTNLKVGSLDNPVQLAPEKPGVRLEFFYGDLSIVEPDGKSAPAGEGIPIAAGDRVITEASTQAEFSIGNFSRIDIDNFSEVIFDKINADEQDKNVTSVFHKAGTGWYKFVYSGKGDMFSVQTPLAGLTIGGSGADFLLEVQADQVVINNMDGLILVERTGGGEAINLIAGQTVTVYNDLRPFQVSRLTPDVSAQERFADLAKQKSTFVARNMPLNFLFYGTPFVCYLISMSFETNTIYSVRITPELLVTQFVQGFSTIDQGFLYGGPVFVNTLIERVLNIRIPKYCIFNKDDVIRVAGAIGGVTVTVDGKAASYIHSTAGLQKLKDEKLVKFLSPQVSGILDARRRQEDAIRSIFEGFRKKSIIMTTVLADQLLSNIETNFTGTEVMSHYTNFNNKQNWTFKSTDLPSLQKKVGNRNCYEPDLEKCRTLFSAK